MIKIRDEVKKMLDKVIENRRYLHMYPEIELNTVNTKRYLIEKIKAMGLDEIEEGYAKNGFVAYLKVNDKASCVALRSDIDALPIKEETNLEFQSKNKGCAHACGHDGHMAILLATVQYLVKHKHLLKENVLFIFQPGEEEPGGASIMIQEGLFQKYPVRAILGTHLSNDVEAGKVSSRAGALMARNGEISIQIYGQSAHGAMPYQGKDALIAAASLIMQLQTIVSRNIDPQKGTVLTLAKINGGEARNVICDYVHIEGTMRSFNDVSYELQKQRIAEISKGIEMSYNVKVKANVKDYYYVVENDPQLHRMLEEVMKEDCLLQEPKMISEDFSFYQKEVPGLFYFTGIKDEAHNKGLHDSRFNFDEKHLLNAVETNLRMLEKLEVLK